MPKQKYKVLEVTYTRQYIVPMIDDERTKINGWSMKDVIQDWFYNHDLNSHHATRDGSRIGNSVKLHKVEEIDEFEG